MKSLLCKSITEACDRLEAGGFELWKRRGLAQADNKSYGEKVFYSDKKCTAEVFMKRGTPNSYVTLFYDDPTRYGIESNRYGHGSNGKLYVIGVHIYKGKRCELSNLPGTLLCHPRVRFQLNTRTWRGENKKKMEKPPRWYWHWSESLLASKTSTGNEISMRRIESETPIFKRY